MTNTKTPEKTHTKISDSVCKDLNSALNKRFIPCQNISQRSLLAGLDSYDVLCEKQT